MLTAESRLMMKIALFSTDIYFVKVFSNYIAKKQNMFELMCYTNIEHAREVILQEKWDVILTEKGYLQEFIQKIQYIELGTHTILPKEDKIGSLNIYQKAPNIVEDLERILQVIGGEELSLERKETGFVTSFFSTEGGSGKSTLAYLTAVIAAKSKKTIYLNLEPLASVEVMYHQEYLGTMENILFSIKDKRNLQTLICENLIKNKDGVYTLPIIQSIGDYLTITPEDIMVLIEYLITKGGIELIIADLPCGFSDVIQKILEYSKVIVWIFSDTAIGNEKCNRWIKDPYITRSGYRNKSLLIKNKCMKKQEKDINITFPFSQSMYKSEQISAALLADGEFFTGCEAIVKELVE